MSPPTPGGDAVERIPPFKRSTDTDCARCGASISPHDYCYRIGCSGGGTTRVSPEDTLVCVSCGETALRDP